MERDEILAMIKMSKSKPGQTIFVHASPDDIRRIISKAYCPPREVNYNPIIEINKYLLFQQDGFKLVVERPAKYGGTIIYETYDELERDYIEGKLHPADLKQATAEALIKFLEPIRASLLSDRELVEVIRKIEEYYRLNK